MAIAATPLYHIFPKPLSSRVQRYSEGTTFAISAKFEERLRSHSDGRTTNLLSTQGEPFVDNRKDKSNTSLRLPEPYRSSSPQSSESSGFVRTKLAVFVSGGGSNFKAIQKAISEGKIFGEIVLVVSDKPDCGGCQFAREEKIPVVPFPRSKNAPDGVSTQELIESLRSIGVEFVVLAGFLKLLPSELISAFPRAILNIHPSLLPAFGGKGFFGSKVHQGVIRSGARYSGATVHFVDEIYDNGPIIAQKMVPVYPFDSPKDLQQRVLAEEHKLYSHVIAALCEDRITWREDGVPLIRRSWNGCEYE